jgi:hypothetical protein
VCSCISSGSTPASFFMIFFNNFTFSNVTDLDMVRTCGENFHPIVLGFIYGL